MAETIRTKCHIGQLVITDTVVRIETRLLGQSTKSLSRSSITGVDIMPYPKLLGIGGKYTDLTFYSSGGVLHAKMVKIDVARKILEILGY